MDLLRTIPVAVLGGLLGVLLMIPLRRGLVVESHGKLAFPEGTACAEVLVAGERGGTNAKTVFTGFGVGFLFKLLNGEGGLRLLKNTPERVLGFFKGGSVAAEVAPELLGVGYIVGPKIGGIMCAGGVLAYLVLIPAIKIFGEGRVEPMFPATTLIRDMSPHEIRNAYVLYIGAGAVAAGGIISLLRVIPTIVRAFAAGLGNLVSGQRHAAGGTGGQAAAPRTDRDLPAVVVVVGCVALVCGLMLLPSLHISLFGAVLIIMFGFLFVTVSSRLVGEIGSSSNPISGMTVATLLMTCLLFLAFGWTTPTDRLAALSIAAVVCVASSNGGTTAQDLKTGFLVGATPRWQQIGILVGALTSAIVIGGSLQLFNDTATIYAKRDFPQVTLESKYFEARDTVHGPEAKYDTGSYNVVHLIDENVPRGAAGEPLLPLGKYLADDSGKIRYLVDPGINGVLDRRDPAPGEAQGTFVRKFDAPKARLMSLIIDGILTRKLPWGLVLIGVFIAFALELMGIASLPFAVGVYLPISASTPIWMGGLVRWLVDRRHSAKVAVDNTSDDASPGVMLSSGLIAGGAIAGMLLAIFSGLAEDLSHSLDLSARAAGTALGVITDSDVASMAAFLLLAGFVYAVGRGKLLASKTKVEPT